MLIDDAIPFMNLTISNYLEKIGGRYVVSFDTQAETKAGEFRDKIAVRVLDTKTKANNRKKLSGGQVRLTDIATILTLCDLQNNVQDIKFNLLLFDEIFDSLDDENIGLISNLLRSLVSDKSIYIISHRQIDSIEADEYLRFY
jgi:DNA repair exonuclease SbcCD ATPase subunit